MSNCNMAQYVCTIISQWRACYDLFICFKKKLISAYGRVLNIDTLLYSVNLLKL